MSNELAVVQQQSFDLASIEKMSDYVVKSGLFPVKDKSEAVVLMMLCQSENINPVQAFLEFDIICKKIAMKADTMLARFMRGGGKWQWKENSDKRAAAIATFNGATSEVEYTIAEAAAMQLTGKDNWKKFPAQMLSARVVAEGVRACFPACLSGMYTVEEAQDEAPATVATKEFIDGEIVEVTEDVSNLDPAVVEQFKSETSMEELQNLWH